MAFGAMTFGQGTLVGDLVNDIDQKLADRMVGLCLDAGINFFDTADMYTSGQSEIMLGQALKEKRHDAIVATKCGFRSGEAVTARGLSRRYILAAVEESLGRLDTDYIDLFLLHIPDPLTPLEETARALDDVVRKGWVLSKPFVSSVIIGARSIHQLDDNLKAGELVLSQEDLRFLDDLTVPEAPYPTWMQGMAWDDGLKAALGI